MMNWLIPSGFQSHLTTQEQTRALQPLCCVLPITLAPMLIHLPPWLGTCRRASKDTSTLLFGGLSSSCLIPSAAFRVPPYSSLWSPQTLMHQPKGNVTAPAWGMWDPSNKEERAHGPCGGQKTAAEQSRTKQKASLSRGLYLTCG